MRLWKETEYEGKRETSVLPAQVSIWGVWGLWDRVREWRETPPDIMVASPLQWTQIQQTRDTKSPGLQQVRGELATGALLRISPFIIILSFERSNR